MLYTKERYPADMDQLPEEVRRQAIRITNEMMMDGDIRHHEDLIVAIAIGKAKSLSRDKKASPGN